MSDLRLLQPGLSGSGCDYVLMLPKEKKRIDCKAIDAFFQYYQFTFRVLQTIIILG